MKKRLQSIYWRGIVITLAMAVLAIGLAVKLKIDDTRSSLEVMLQAASKWTLDSNDDLGSLADSIAGISPPMRVTFLMNTGLILADSGEDPDPGTNHYSDPEIASARRGGIGRDLRLSGTGTVFELLMAKKIAPQLILRVSYPIVEMVKLPIVYSIALIITFLVLYYLLRQSIARFADDQNRQFENIRCLLDGDITKVRSVFPEFQPAMDEIAYRIRRLKEDHQEVLDTINLRGDFVANASHELRSPLTSIHGFAEMLEEGLADTPEEQALCIRTIRTECDRMLEVIGDILRLNRAEHAAPEAAERLHVLPVAEEIRRSLLPRASQKGIRIEIEGDTVLRMSEKDIWETLYNLMDNAVRYGRQGGSVRIRLREDRIEVEDDGIGIGEEHIDHIFEQFYRVDDARTAEAGGTGLGLSIVRTLVERSGGRISVRSRPGEGTVFILDFAAET